MTPTHGIIMDFITTPNPLEEYKWSSCTVDMIRNYITNGGGQCLLEQSNKKNHDDDIYKIKVDERKPKNLFNEPTPPPKKNNVNVNVNVPTGIKNKFSLDDALLGIDNECKVNGASGICTREYKDGNTCKPVVCEYRQRRRRWCKTIDRQVVPKSPCGDDKICLDGYCVDAEVLNELPDFGDNNDDYNDDNNDNNNDDNDESFYGDNN